MTPLERAALAMQGATTDRERAKAALDALRDPIIDAFAGDSPSQIDKFRDLWRNRIELPR